MALAVVSVVGAGVVGSAAAAGPGPAPGTALTPTTGKPSDAGPGLPPSSVPPLGTSVAQPTAVPPTSSWIVTTSTIALATTPSTRPDVSTPATASTAAAVTSFDGLAFLTDVYAALADDPFTLLDIAEQRTVINTPADVFIAHLLGVTITHQIDLGQPLPSYTVSQDGKAVQVCSDGASSSASKCEVFSDFYAPTGLLETFSINGVPLAVSALFRNINVESLAVDSTLCLMQFDGALSCVILLTSQGASTALHWDQAVFTSDDGRQFRPDLNRSAFTPSIAADGFGSGHLIFPGAALTGAITLPIVSGLSGTLNTVSIPLSEV